MIPTLLWRCPLCATNDALAQVARPFRGDLVHCRACHAEWRLRRVPGDNFYLKLTRDGDHQKAPQWQETPERVGDERSVAAWYDAMKATVHLTPTHDPALALHPGETLYLASGPAHLQAETGDPLFFPTRASASASRADKREVRGAAVGTGRLFLTDRRLVWQSTATTSDFLLTRLNSALTLLADGLVLMVELRLYTVRFQQESLLKWVTYIALIAPQVEAATGHRIATSHF